MEFLFYSKTKQETNDWLMVNGFLRYILQESITGVRNGWTSLSVTELVEGPVP